MSQISRKPVPEKPLSEDFTKDTEDIERISTEIQEPPPVRAKNYKILGWELSAHRSPQHTNPAIYGSKPTVAQRFNRMVPPHRRYLGMSRKLFLILLAIILVVLLGLIIGLPVGLSKSKKAQNLPLPTDHQIHTGDLTYYAPGLGACGITSSASDSIVAVSHLVFDAAQTGSNPNANPLCGKKIRASRFDEQVGAQRSVDLTVVDRCVGCKATDIDVTITAFDQLADQARGRVPVSWAWLDIDM